MTPKRRDNNDPPDAPLEDRSVPTGNTDVDAGKFHTKVHPEQPEAPHVHPDVASEQDRQKRDTERKGPGR